MASFQYFAHTRSFSRVFGLLLSRGPSDDELIQLFSHKRGVGGYGNIWWDSSDVSNDRLLRVMQEQNLICAL